MIGASGDVAYVGNPQINKIALETSSGIIWSHDIALKDELANKISFGSFLSDFDTLNNTCMCIGIANGWDAARRAFPEGIGAQYGLYINIPNVPNSPEWMTVVIWQDARISTRLWHATFWGEWATR